VIKTGRSFYKLSGSGNDFVFIDARSQPVGELEKPEVVQTICARGSGVGADGIVFLMNHNAASIAIRYLNSDGSLAELCGNATLCAARLAAELQIVDKGAEFEISTDSGSIVARFRGELPEIDLQPVTELQDCFDAKPIGGEARIGFALVGVPHLVVLCADVERAAIVDRGRELRRHANLANGANVNFVSRASEGWRIRTYERGVEAETLACGTGAVATGLMLAAWGETSGSVELRTRSGRILRVRHRVESGRYLTSLSGEARIVFRGELGEFSNTTS
jgi:diaminopimelate epimerase